MAWRRLHDELALTLVDSEARVAALTQALEAMRELAAVAHNGDPWYAEQEGLDVDAIFAQAEKALEAR